MRFLFITPALHRIHHSELLPEQNGNFGTIFSLWDRLFGTYLAEPFLGAAQVRCGLAELSNGSALGPVGLLLLPFKRTLVANDSAQLAGSVAVPSAVPSAVLSDKMR